MKPEAITSHYHFNEFFELKYCFWQAEFECVTYLLLTGICHLLAAYWNLAPTCCMLATDNTEFHLDMHTTVLNCEF